DRAHCVAQALVGGGLGGELALELVGDERAGGLGAAGRGGEGGGGPEAALEPAPAQPGRVQLVADVLAGQRRSVADRAVVLARLGVGDEREATLAVADRVTLGVRPLLRLPDHAAVSP